MDRHPKLPLRITLLLFLVLSITAWNLVRIVTAFAWRNALAEYLPAPGAYYLVITAAIWAFSGIFVLWSFWRGTARSDVAILIWMAAYFVWVWLDRLLFQHPLQPNWPFDLVATLIVLGYTAVVVLDPRNQNYFGKRTNERESPNPTSS